MRWLIFSDEHDAVVKQCDDLLSTVGQTVLHEHHHGKSSLQAIKESIAQYKPNRIIVVANEKKPSVNAQPLVTALSDHLLIPLYVGQATINTYSTIPVLLLTFNNGPAAPDSILPLDIIQSATDELIHVYPHIINAKIFTPIVDEELNETALLTKFQSLWRDNPEGPHYITILSDILPILLALAHDGKVSGQVNVCNKGTVSLHWLEQYLAKQIKRDLNGHQVLPGEDLTDQLETWNKQMITPETRHLYQASFVVPNGAKSIEECLQQNSIQLDPVGPRILLVTGGCGFIGSTFINHWLKTYPDDRIINIDRLDAVSNVENIENASSPNYSLIVADINNKDIVLHLMRQYDITHVVHFAVQAHLDNSFGNSITFTETNVYGTHSVLEATRTYGKIQKIIHISTDEVYGETPEGSYQETNLLNPLNPYAATIAAAEFLVKSYGESFKLSYCIVRLSNVYGPRQHIEKVIPAFINNVLRGEKLKVHGDGKQTRLYIYVDDVIQAIESIFQRGKTKMVYNVGAENELTVLDIAKQILHKFNVDGKADEMIVHSSGRSFTEKRYSSTSTSGAMKTLGWKAKVSFDEGLDKTIRWYKEHPDYWSK